MPFEPISPLGGFTATPELPRPSEDAGPAPTTSETFGAAFRTDNTIGSLFASQDAHFAGGRIDETYDPWGEIADTPYEPYYENFARAQNKEHAAAIKADIDRENKDRDIMGRSGATGMLASFVAGTVDWPILIPGGNIYRSATGGFSLLKTALSTGVAGGIAGAASEVMLQNTQQLRTAEESAMVIGGSAVLSGLLGAGFGKIFSKADLDAFAPRVERDFTVPGVDQPDPFMPGGLRPSVEAVEGASDRSRAVADAIRETAEEILPRQVRVQVVDSLGAVGDVGTSRFSFAGPRASNADTEALARAKEMAASRAPRDDIWRATGWFQGVDGKWRFEIADDGARLIEDEGGLIRGLDHPALREGYAGLPTVGGRFGPDVEASGFNFEGKLAAFGPDQNTARGVAMHEIQHDLQRREGFARGTSTTYLALSGKVKFSKEVQKQIAVIDKKLRKVKSGTAEYDALVEEKLAIKEQAAMEAYFRTAGEVEARNVQRRMAMTPEERSATPPWKTQDVPDEQQLVWPEVVDSLGAPGDDGKFSLRGFYSPAIRAAEGIAMQKGTGEQFLKQITKVPGVRKDELEWMGLEEFLAGKQSVTKDEVMDFMRAHQVELDEKVLGGKPSDKTLIGGSVTPEQFRKSTGASEDAFPDADIQFIEQFSVSGKTFYVIKREGSFEYSVVSNKLDDIGRAARRSEAEHIGQGWAKSKDESPRFSDYKVPGGENYRELLIRLPDLEGKYTSKHFNDQELVHLRVDDRTGPNGEKVLFINEVQSDLHQAGRAAGYSTDEYRQKMVDARARVIDAENELSKSNSSEAFKTFEEAEEKLRKVELAFGPAPQAPFKGDLWLELGLKRALRYAAENGYDAISWARSDQIAKAVGTTPEKLTLQYDSKIGKFFDKYTKKWGAKVEPPHGKTAEMRELDVREADAATNPILRITPEMRASVMEGQPFSVRQTDAGVTAEGRFDPDKLLITIAADSLDPAKTLRHESIHALKQMGLFTGKEWATLEAAARKQGWVESNNVRSLYEGVYKDRITPELLTEEAIAEQFSLWRQGASGVKGIIAKLFQRIQQFLERTGNALRGRGFQTADDVFAAVRGGDVASRAPGAAPAGGGIPGAAGLGRATSVGASAVARADDTVKSAYGLEKATAFMHPTARLQQSVSTASRRNVQELAEVPTIYEKNALGEPTAPGGSEMGAPGAVETRIKFWQAPLGEAVQAVDNAFLMYRKGHAKRFPGEAAALTLKDTVFGTDALTHTQFKQEIAKALRQGDQHAIPEVAGVARIWRKTVFDPLKDDAVAIGLLPEDVTPETAASYLNRMYNKDRIIAERDQFKKVVSDWLEGQENINVAVRRRVTPLLERRQVLEARVSKYERQIETRKLSAAKVAARRQEASGLNRFAFQRAQKLSEPLDETRAAIDAISAKIATEMERIDELTAGIRAEKVNLPQLQSIERQSIKLAHGLAKVKRDAALIDVVEGAAEIEASMKDLTATFKGVQTFLRKEATAMRAEDWAAPLVALEKQRASLSRKVAPFTKQLGALRKLQQKTEKARLPGARGGAVFESKIRSRVNTLADQEAGRKAEIEALQGKLDRAQDELTSVRSDMEAQIEIYQGKTAGEAKGAIKSRAKAESLRTPEQRAKQPRLGSADKAVLVAARKIAAQLDKEPGEITSIADQIIDRIIGHPDGRLPYDAHMSHPTQGGVSSDARGPLAARQFMIPDAAIERWLENDIEVLGRAYVRTMAPDVELTKRFGQADMQPQMREIEEEYDRLLDRATTDKQRTKLEAQKKQDRIDLAAIRDRLRGTYSLPKNPDGLLVRTGRVVRSLNYMRMLGNMTVSALPDLGGTVLAHGIMRTVGDGIVPLMRNWSGARLAMNEVKLSGTALDMVLDSRSMAMNEVMEDFGRHSKFERAVSVGASKFGVVSLMAPWNASLKQFAGIVTQTRMLRAMERMGKGTAKPKEIELLASGGISPANARKIAAQFAKHGKKEGGVWWANTADWEERSAIEAFRGALVKEVDRIIVTPGQEKPLWMSTEWGAMLGQFKSFQIASMQRVVIASLQRGLITSDMATLSGIFLMTALGGASSVLRAKIAGQPGPDLSDDKKKLQFFVEAVDRAGLTGWLMEANAMTEKLTRGAVGLSALTGKPVSRYAQRNLMGSMLGPTAGTAQDFARIAGSAASGEWNQTDTRVMRRLIPYNNIFYARQMFDQAEAGINGFLGVPKAAGAGARR